MNRGKPTKAVLTQGMVSDCKGLIPKSEYVVVRVKGDKSFATVSFSDDKNHFVQVVLTNDIKALLRECL